MSRAPFTLDIYRKSSIILLNPINISGGTKMEKLKVGIIGCGGIANSKHMPALKSQNDKCEMVAFCDIIPERAQKAAAKYGIDGAKVYEIGRASCRERV